MDERKEKAAPDVSAAILGEENLVVRHVHVHRVRDCSGVLYESPDIANIVLFLGSRMEH